MQARKIKKEVTNYSSDASTIGKHEIKEHIRLLKKIDNVQSAKYLSSVVSSVTLNWGVEWSPDFIARDVFQNFRDGCIEQGFDVSSIKTKVKNGQIHISSPSEFNLKALFYVGSTKGGDENQIGQYGEGSKAVFVSLIKMGVENPIAISGDEAVIISVAEENEMGMCPLVYNFYKIKPKKSGSSFVVHTYKDNLKDAFKNGLEDHFWWPENPNVGELLHHYNDIEFYKSNSDEGKIFYCGINRGSIKGIPLIINIKKKYAKIEKKIQSDRDRNSFSQELKTQLFSLISRSGFHYSTDATNPAIQYILEATKGLWTKGQGHPLIQAICDNIWNLYTDESSPYLDNLFSKSKTNNGFYCESSNRYARLSYSEWWEWQPKVSIKDRARQKKGLTELPAYFSRLGIKSSVIELVEKKREVEEKAKRDSTRQLSKSERTAVNFTLQCIRKVAPEFAQLFSDIEDSYNVSMESRYGTMYSVDFIIVKSDTLLGELRDENSQFGDKVVYLNQILFTGSFGQLLSTLTHELTHVFSYDGSRSFSDALTIMMKRFIEKPEVLSEYNKKWEDLKSV